MNKLFCVSCGHKILYEVKKPKFCPECGQSLDGLSKASTEQDVDEQPELDVDLDKLKRDIVVESSNQKTTVEQIWGSVTAAEAGMERDSFSRPASKDPDGKELLDQTIKDCSSSRMRDVDE
jgi:hypothetical protein|tara:strand:- start:757 stop:1119 length:363 start_codon:yes stop_codon:yes gene_type:complete